MLEVIAVCIMMHEEAHCGGWRHENPYYSMHCGDIMLPPPNMRAGYENKTVMRLSKLEIVKACGVGHVACALPPIQPGGACIIMVPK